LNQGQPIFSMVNLGGVLFACDGAGRLLQWNGVNAWTVAAPQLTLGEAPLSLAVLGGSIYAGTSPSGLLYKWNGTNAWVKVASQYGTIPTMLLIVYNGEIYGLGFIGSSYTPTGVPLVKWDGVSSWIEVAPMFSPPQYLSSAVVHDGILYIGTGYTDSGTFYGGYLLHLEGSSLVLSADRTLSDGDDAGSVITSLVEFNGHIYGINERQPSTYGGDLFVLQFASPLPPPSPKLVGSNLNGGAYRISRRLL
jgi:hypothetical protein